MSVVDDPTGSGRGKVAKLHYGPVAARSTTSGIDDNTSLTTRIPQRWGQTVFFRGEYYIDVADLGPEGEPTWARKLLYVKSHEDWDKYGVTGKQHKFRVVVGAFGPNLCVTATRDWAGDPNNFCIAPVMRSRTWFTLEVELRMESRLAAGDGVLRLWKDGVLMYENTRIQWTELHWEADMSTDDMYFEDFLVGQQVNTLTLAYDEDRYLNNVAFSTQRLGPAPEPTPPPPDPEPEPTPDPVEGVAIQPDQSIQSFVNAHPAGTTFILKAGIHRRQTIIPKDGQRFIGEPGAILDGEGVTQWAVDLRTSPRKNVTLKGLVIRNYTPVNSGGVRGMIAAYNGTGWIIEDNEIHGSTMSGLEIGPGTIVRRNKIHSNRYSGIGGRPNGGLVEDNDVYLNGSAPKEDASVEGRSGMKFARAENLTIRGNRVYRNYADGIWCDIDCRFVTVEGNHVYENSGRGIYYEISYDGLIRNNLVERNCLACGPGIGNAPNWYTGIAVSTSTRVTVSGNTLRDNAAGIQVRSDARGSGIYGTYKVVDFSAVDNVVSGSGVLSGLHGTAAFSNVKWDRNRYSTGGSFYWPSASRTWSQWRALGQDVNGSVQ